MVKKRKTKKKGRSAAFMRSINPFLKRKRSKSKLNGQSMAKRRGRKRYSRKGSSISKKGLISVIVGGILYGASRKYISDKLSPITAKVPMGAYSDNVVMAGVSYGAMKYGKKLPFGSYISEAGKVGLGVESALAGADLTTQFVPTT